MKIVAEEYNRAQGRQRSIERNFRRVQLQLKEGWIEGYVNVKGKRANVYPTPRGPCPWSATLFVSTIQGCARKTLQRPVDIGAPNGRASPSGAHRMAAGLCPRLSLSTSNNSMHQLASFPAPLTAERD
uniref:Uncharacterized protein n=1 Tax=Plectus sambesii TaxID=2011161 RepID=A0A914WXF1_9BILA